MNIAVIGAGSGLGLVLSSFLLERGHTVLVTYNKGSEELNLLEKNYPQNLTIIKADISKTEDMVKVAKGIPNGCIDTLVITAGIISDVDRNKKLHEIPMKEILRTFDVNFFGPLHTVQLFIPIMRKSSRCFVVTSEGSALNQIGTWIPAYGLSKSAATKMCGVLMASQDRVEVYAVHPGRMNTEMGRQTAQIEPEETAAYFVRLIEGDIPLSRKNWYINYTGESLL